MSLKQTFGCIVAGVFLLNIYTNNATPDTSKSMHKNARSIHTSCSLASTISDARLKKNIQNIATDDSLNRIRQLTPKSFDFCDDAIKCFGLRDCTQRGFIAQEAKSIVPEMVAIVAQPTPLTDDIIIDDLHVISYASLIPDLVGALKACDHEVTMQKSILIALMNRFESLEARLANVTTP